MDLNRQTTRFLKLFIAAAISSASIGALALDAAPVALGPVEMVPTLGLGIENNSNIYTVENNAQSSAILVVNPELLFQARDRLDTYKARIFIDSGTYSDSLAGDDDYVDYGVLFDTHWEFTARNKLDMYLSFQKLHDDRGSVFTDNIAAAPITEPDTYDSNRFGGIYEYGLRSNFALSAELFTYDKAYTNNLNDSGPSKGMRNYTQNEADITAYFGVAPKTSMFVEVDFANYSYEKDLPTALTGGIKNLNSDEVRAYIGVEWDISAQFTGRAKVGQVTKTFDDASLKKLDMPTWKIYIDYLPTRIDTLVFTTGSDFRETQASGIAIEATTFGMSWDHQWMDRLNTVASYAYNKEDHGTVPGAVVADRVDKTNTIKVALVYNFKRWMDMGVSLENNERSSNRAGLDYSQNIVMLNLDLSL